VIKETSLPPKSVVRSTRLITFVCQQCGEEVTEERHPSHMPLYCSRPGCKAEATRIKTRARVAAHRKRKAEQPPAPLTCLFPEKTRGYLLLVHCPGRLAIEATSGESCLQAMKACADGEIVTILGKHRDQEIGCAEYRKRGQPGRVESVETLSASGDLVGLIEAALARRAEEQQKQIQSERAERLIQLACSCDQSVGYDEIDHCFALPDGSAVTVCPACGKLLDLGQITRDRELRIATLQRELQQQQTALRLVQRVLID